MAVIDRAEDFNVPDLFIDLEPVFGDPLVLKCEGMNFAGSIKLKTAVSLIDRAEAQGRAVPGRTTLVESSSGNLGIGISLVAASRGYDFVCVTDSRCNLGAAALMRSLGATVEIITAPHPQRGLLGARLDRVADLVHSGRNTVWLNQYQNSANWEAHYCTTGPEILREFDVVDTIFVGVGTAGTAMGVAQYVRRKSPRTTIVGVDVEGSVSFGGPAGTRHVPGIGSSIRPPLLDRTLLDDLVYVSEPESISACRALVARGYVFGGSTGSVVAGALRWLADRPTSRGARNIAVAPDLGERYLDTIYQDQWVRDLYGDAPLQQVASGLPEAV